MSTSLHSIQDYWQVLAFPFRDRQALKKIGIGVLLVLLAFIIPLLPMLAVCGYAVRIMKRILHQDGTPFLPEWNQWDVLFQDGLKAWGTTALASLPLVFLIWITLSAMILPWPILAILEGASGELPRGATSIATIMTGIGMLGFILTLVLSLPLALVQAPMLGHVVAHDSFQAVFRVKEWWNILRAGLEIFLITTAVGIALSWAGSFLVSLSVATLFLCWLYPFLLAFYAFLMTLYSYTLIALAYREARGRLAT